MPPARRRHNRGATLKRTLIFAALVALGGALPATAHGHAAIAKDGDTIVYVAIDSTSRSTLTVTVTADSVRLRDPTIDGGMAPGECVPGAADRYGYIVEVTCPRKAETKLRADVGALDDSVEIRGDAMPTFILAGAGSDRVVGGPGPDILDGGAGRDELNGGDGDDELRSRDGNFEVVGCGDGADRAYLDVPDVGDGCETVENADPPPPPRDPDRPPPDTRAPEVEASAPRRQRVTRPLRAFATVDEVATVSATATVRFRGRRHQFVSPQRRSVPGERLTLTLRANRATVRRLRRAKRALYATVTIVAIDDAANGTAARTARIRLV